MRAARRLDRRRVSPLPASGRRG